MQLCYIRLFLKWVLGKTLGALQLYLCDTHGELSSCCLGRFRLIQSVYTEHQKRWPSSAFFGQPHPATTDSQQLVH